MIDILLFDEKNSIYNIEDFNANKEYNIFSKNNSDDDDSLNEYFDRVDKEIREKDKKYHITRTKNKVNFFTSKYEEDSPEYLFDLYDFQFGDKEEKDEKINNIENEEDKEQLSNIKYDLNDKYNLNDKDNLNEINDDINEREINQIKLIEKSNDNNEIKGKIEIKNNNKKEFN